MLFDIYGRTILNEDTYYLFYEKIKLYEILSICKTRFFLSGYYYMLYVKEREDVLLEFSNVSGIKILRFGVRFSNDKIFRFLLSDQTIHNTYVDHKKFEDKISKISKKFKESNNFKMMIFDVYKHKPSYMVTECSS